MKIINSLEQFENEINADKISILVMSAGWCPDCVYLKTFLDKLVEENQEFNWLYADREENLELAKFYNILGIPSFLAFKSGEKIGSLINKERKSKDTIEKFLNTL